MTDSITPALPIDHDVDFLDVILPDVAGDQLATGRVEREAERITQTVGVDLMHGGAATDEGIARRNAVAPVRAGGVGAARGERGIERIDAQNFAEHGGEILAVAGDVVVAVADVIGSAAVA